MIGTKVQTTKYVPNKNIKWQTFGTSDEMSKITFRKMERFFFSESAIQRKTEEEYTLAKRVNLSESTNNNDKIQSNNFQGIDKKMSGKKYSENEIKTHTIDFGIRLDLTWVKKFLRCLTQKRRSHTHSQDKIKYIKKTTKIFFTSLCRSHYLFFFSIQTQSVCIRILMFNTL